MATAGGSPVQPLARGHELRLRVVSGLLLAAAAIGTAWLGGIVFAALWLAAGVAVAVEWIALTGGEPRRLLQGVAAAGIAGLVAAYSMEAPAFADLAIGAVAALTLAVMGRSPAASGWTLAGFGLGCVVALVPIALRGTAGLGAAAVLWLFAVVWSTDVAAFFGGRAIGGPPLAPRISPKKTWSGFFTGLLAATLAGLAVAALARQAGAPLPGSLAAVAAVSAAASLASQAGDLAESAVKRRFGVKDSGRLIPGHGGILDRLDGFAAVALLAGVALAAASLAAVSLAGAGSEP